MRQPITRVYVRLEIRPRLGELLARKTFLGGVMKNDATLTLPGNEEDVLFRLELMVARRADRLAGGSQRSPTADRLSWRQAEEEIFGVGEPALHAVEAVR